MAQKSVLLLGSYGQSNLGDDLLMWNYLELLKERGFTTVYVNANTTEFLPQPVKDAYPGLKIVDTYRTPMAEYIRLIRRVDCIVYGGGTLYKELYASTGRSKYSVIVRMMGFNMLAKLLGTKLYHLHIGTGSLKTRQGRLIARLGLAAATKTVFRDQQSYDFAKNVLRVPPARIAKSTDGLFINHIWEKPWHTARLSIDRKKYRRVVGINVLSDIPDWVDRDRYVRVMQQFVQTLHGQGDYVVMVPFQHAFNPRSDLAFMRETFGGTIRGDGYAVLDEVPIDLAVSYLRQCDVFVGMRFHSLLLSTASRVPFVAVAYDTKCWRFVEETDYPYAVKLEDLSLDGLLDLYKKAAANRGKTRKQLDAVAKRLYAEAEEGLRTLDL